VEAGIVHVGFVIGKVALGQDILQTLPFSHTGYSFTNVRYSFIIRDVKIGPPEVAVQEDSSLSTTKTKMDSNKWISKA
jgi:hypothetical protein